MPKNKVQFQKGLSLPSFLSQYGSEQQCREALFSLRCPDGFFCPNCGYGKYSMISTRLLYQSCNYYRQASLARGTVFKSTKHPQATWFLAIYVITQSKDGISSLNLSRTIGTPPNTAQRMKHKPQQHIGKFDNIRKSPCLVQMNDAHIGGKRPSCKRSRCSAGKVSFLAAVSTDVYGKSLYMRLNKIAGFKLDEVGRCVAKHIYPRSIVVTDGLPCFDAVQHAGVAARKPSPSAMMTKMPKQKKSSE